jgi:hypothetical protein
VPLSSPREDLQSAAQLPLLHTLHLRAGTDSKYTVHRVHTYTLWIAQYSTYTYITDRTVQYLHIHYGSYSTVLTHTLWIAQYSTYTYIMDRTVQYLHIHYGSQSTVLTHTLWIAQYSTYTYIMDRTVQYLHIHYGSHSTVHTHTLWIVQYSTYIYIMDRAVQYLHSMHGTVQSSTVRQCVSHSEQNSACQHCTAPQYSAVTFSTVRARGVK